MQRHTLGVALVLMAALFAMYPAGAASQESIKYDGSSQMYWAFVKDSADLFTREAGIPVTAEDRKTQDAIPSLASGRCNIGGMARKMKLIEKAQGKDLVETLIARDHMAVFIQAGGKLEELSMADLKKVFTGQIADWKDLGDAPGPIQVVIPQTRTASNRNFAEIVMGEATFPASSIITETAGGVLDEVKKQRSISFISFGAISNKPEFKILKIDGKPASDAGYPINQEMYFVTQGEPSGNIKKYVDFFLSGGGRDFIVKAGLLPAK